MTGKLELFTGYYAMNSAPGAFLSIDTTETYVVPAIQQKTTTITINVSLNGQSCATYAFDNGATFDGTTLNIPGVLALSFTRAFANGNLASFAGTIGTTTVTGSTYFNPVPLSAFAGDYYDTATQNLVLSVKKEAGFSFDYTIFSGSGGQLQQVNKFTYVPGMYVLEFADGAQPIPFILMLGTNGAHGLACSIQLAGYAPHFAVSILTPANLAKGSGKTIRSGFPAADKG